MLTIFLNLWFNLSAKVRYGLLGLPIILSAIAALVLWDVLYLIPGGVISLILWLLTNRSDAEKNGYHF